MSCFQRSSSLGRVCISTSLHNSGTDAPLLHHTSLHFSYRRAPVKNKNTSFPQKIISPQRCLFLIVRHLSPAQNRSSRTINSFFPKQTGFLTQTSFSSIDTGRALKGYNKENMLTRSAAESPCTKSLWLLTDKQKLF